MIEIQSILEWSNKNTFSVEDMELFNIKSPEEKKLLDPVYQNNRCQRISVAIN